MTARGPVCVWGVSGDARLLGNLLLRLLHYGNAYAKMHGTAKEEHAGDAHIRIDETLKERGDRVLRDNGVSTSTAVRSLWAHMASTRELPDFLRAEIDRQDGRDRKKAALKAFAGIAEGACSNMTDAEMHAMYRSRYE